MTVPFDYSQQVYAYLQAWRQMLESLAAMAAAMPLPGALPGMIPAAPYPAAPPPGTSTPPALADYTQQLFGYLQAWRQYLEQTVGAPAAPRMSGQPFPGEPAHANPPPRGRGEAVPSTNPLANKARRDDGSDSSGSPWPPKPDKVALVPSNQDGGLMPGERDIGRQYTRQPIARINEGQSIEVPASRYRQAAVIARGDQVARPPALEFGQQVTPLGTAQNPGVAAVTRAGVPSLFKGLRERTPGIE